MYKLRSLATVPALAALAIAFTPAPAQQAGPYTIVETGQSFTRLQDAVNAIGDGRGTIRFASRSYADCAVQEKGDIAYVAAVPGQAVLDGKVCQDKAALVLKGRSARVEGLVFANMHVGDWNGAGIRLQKGDLTVSQSWFRDSQQGILTHSDPDSSIVIDKSTFTRLGTCEGSGGCAHSIYIGDYGLLRVTRSRFEQGRGGHYVKSRGARIDVRDSSFDDSGGRGTNYMIDLPNGAQGTIANNWFVQGRNKENYSGLIIIGAKESWRSSAGLRIENNDARTAPGVTRDSTFVIDFTGEKLAMRGNSLSGRLKEFELY